MFESRGSCVRDGVLPLDLSIPSKEHWSETYVAAIPLCLLVVRVDLVRMQCVSDGMYHFETARSEGAFRIGYWIGSVSTPILASPFYRQTPIDVDVGAPIATAAFA
jgi:hypothetical protein